MKRSRRLATTRKNRKLPSWALWTESSHQEREELSRSKEDLWLRLQACRIAFDVIDLALKRSLSETNTIVKDMSIILHRCAKRELDGTTVDVQWESVCKDDLDVETSAAWQRFVIHEDEPAFNTSLPVLFVDAPLERRDRELWMRHLWEELRIASETNEALTSYQKQRILLFENLNDLIQHRSLESIYDDEEESDYIYMIQSVGSARMFANCIQELVLSRSCIVALRPACVSLDPDRWSADVHVMTSTLPDTEVVVSAFWKHLELLGFPLAVSKAPEATFSGLSSIVDSVRRISANILSQEGSFWAALPMLPLSLVRRARSIHEPKYTVHFLPAVGILPAEWNDTSKKVLLGRLVKQYKALPTEVQTSAKESFYHTILWLDRAPTLRHLERLILPLYDGDNAQPRRETVRALMETTIGEQWIEEEQDLEPYSKRHLAVCGLGRVLKDGVFEKKAHVWCAGD